MQKASRVTFYVSRFNESIILAVYLALALALTYPLVAQFGDHVPGTTTWALDEYTLVWNNWWFKHAVFDLGTNPFQTNFMFYPIGTSLVFYMYTLLHVVIGLPVQFLFGLIPASNAEVLFSFVMSAFGMFLLARYLLRNMQLGIRNSLIESLAAFVAGAVFAFSSNRMVYASLGHYNMVATEWVPFYILFLIRTVHEKPWRNALLAGLFAALALYVEMTYGVLLALFTLLYLVFCWRAVLTRATLARLVVLGATAAVLFAPLLVPALNEIFTSGYALPGWGDADKLVADLVGFLTPTTLNPLNRNWVQELDLVRQGTSRFIDINTVFLGYATLALALMASLRFWKTLKVWATSAIVFAILSLGPLLHINGQSVFDLDGLQVTFPLPFLLLHYIPLLKENRTPNRFSILVMLSLAVLVGFAVAWILGRLSRVTLNRSRMAQFGTAAILLLILLFEHAAVPLPLTDARIPDAYTQIAREAGDFAVLTLPLGWRNSFGQQGAEDTRSQYYQSADGKFYFGGNIERNSQFLFDYFDRVPIFHSLAQLESYNDVPADQLARDKAAASALMTFFDVRYVVINPSIPGRPPYSDTRGAVVDYVQKTLPLGDKIFDENGVLAYRVNQAPLPVKQPIAFGTDAAHLYQAEGWNRDETIAGESANWADRTSARVMFPVRDVSVYAITVRALPFAYPLSPTQTMRVSVNGRAIQNFDLQVGWANYTVIAPASELHAGLNDVVLQFGYAVRPRDVVPANYAIGGTGVSSPMDIEAQAGAQGSIRVNGRETSPQGRGYNVVEIDPKTGAVLSAKLFDTADDIAASRAMTDWIAQIPNGMIVVVASQEDAAANLGDRTVAGLGSLGGQIDPRQNSGRSYVLIGVKGAPAGSAIEQSNDGSSFISVGRSPDVRTLAAAVSEITFEKK